MKNWINRMLSGADKAPDAAGTAGSSQQADELGDDHGVQVDAAYYRWLTASGGYQRSVSRMKRARSC